jgi:hypothetical protein
MPRSGRQKAVLYWFVLDALLVLSPFNYALVNGRREEILGLPIVVLYFILTGACVVFSVIYAYSIDRNTGGVL